MGFRINEDEIKTFKDIARDELKVEFGFPTEGLFAGCAKEELDSIARRFIK